MIIHIDGVQGSGKTYLCNKLKKKITCIDTDDILKKSIYYNRKKSENFY